MAQTSKYAWANVPSGTTDYILVQPDSILRTIKVVSVAFVAGATATNATFNTYPTGGPGVAIYFTVQNGSNGGAILNRNEDGWFWTIGGQGLSITTGSGSTLGVSVNYVYV